MDNTQINQILSLFWKQALAVIDSKYMSVAKSKTIIKTEANKVVPTLIDDRLPEVVGVELDKYALNSTLNNEIAKINDNITAVLAAHTADVNDVKDMIANLDLGVRYVVADSIDGIEVKPGTIYLVPKATADGETNGFTEYLSYTKSDGDVAIEKIGDTTVSFEGYATQNWVNTQISNLSLGTASKCAASSFASSSLASCPGLSCTGTSNLKLGTGATCAACGTHTHSCSGITNFAASVATAAAACGFTKCTGTITSVSSCTVSKAATLTCNYVCFGSNCIWIG